MGSLKFIGPAILTAGLAFAHAALAASAEKGKIAFVQHGCWQCHGFQGQGASTGPRLAPEPIALVAFTAFVRTTDRGMPPYSEAVLSNEDLADIYAYLQSVPKGTDHTGIPLLNE